ncbi:hypothetical protein M0802_010724 [Mischocyttarus mexicanus]|nr:hypothetical protein M0802_010724 [Mischocyttarus mexicanus]
MSWGKRRQQVMKSKQRLVGTVVGGWRENFVGFPVINMPGMMSCSILDTPTTNTKKQEQEVEACYKRDGSGSVGCDDGGVGGGGYRAFEFGRSFLKSDVEQRPSKQHETIQEETTTTPPPPPSPSSSSSFPPPQHPLLLLFLLRILRSLLVLRCDS